MTKKYELLQNDTVKTETGKTLYRIKALIDIDGRVKAGELGGYIEREANLSHDEGRAWVADDAQVFDNAKVLDNAFIQNNAIVCDNARVFGNAIIHDNAKIFGQAQISGEVEVFKSAVVGGNSIITGTLKVS